MSKTAGPWAHAWSNRCALSNQMDKLSINSVWLKEQLSSVNNALDSIRSIRPSQTVW
jgi:hypothetical protein